MLTAKDLRRVYAVYSSSRWRGEAAGATLERWFREHWAQADVGPARPETEPAAISPHGAGGRGIFWYEGPNAILGFVPDRAGCYVVSRSETLPVVAPPKPARFPRSLPVQSVAHFQAGTYARHLSQQLTSPAPIQD